MYQNVFHQNTIGEGAFGLVELVEDNHIGREVLHENHSKIRSKGFLEYEKEVNIVDVLTTLVFR